MKNHIRAWLWITAVLLGALLSSTAQAQITIRGTVRNNRGEALREPEIRLNDAQGRPIPAEVKAQDDGSYVVTVRTKSPTVDIRFDAPGAPVHMLFVTGLSTRDSHEISPVLRQSDGPKSFELIWDQILTYEKVFVAEMAVSKTRPETFDDLNKRYRARIENMPDPDKIYSASSTQYEALRGMTDYQRDLLRYKLWHLRRFYDKRPR
jgi:hypothetical protein